MAESSSTSNITPKGVWSGAFFFQLVALALTFCILWPHYGAWVVEKTELGDRFCWFGEGIWRTNYYWGGISSKPCEEELTPKDAWEEYCNHDSKLFPRELAPSLCNTVKAGRALHVLGIFCSAAAIFLALHFQCRGGSALLPRMAMFSLAVSLLCFAAYSLLLLTSVFLSTAHVDLLGARNLVPYRGLGCVFQSPFVNMDLFHSKPLKCVYPGPALPFTLAICVFQTLGLVCFRIITTRGDEKEEEAEEGEERMYSLHGAFMHKLSKFHRVEMYLVGFLVPLIAVGNGALLLSWFYYGMQFAVKIHVELAGVDFLNTLLQVFTFDPITSVRYLWLGGTWLISLVTAVWLDFFPLFKILVWMYFWFVPANQALRGQVFNWLEYLGRWSLANLFCMCVIAIGFLFDEELLLFNGLVKVNVQVLIARGAGVDWFIASVIWTVALGNVFLDIHLLARDWEEVRAREMVRGETAAPTRISFLLRVLTHATEQIKRSTGERRALWRQEFYPTNALRRVRFTTRGRVLVSALLALQLGLILVCFFLPVIAFERSGVVPNALVSELDTEHDLWGLIQRTYQLGGRAQPLWTFAAMIALFCALLPVLHALGLFLLWRANLAAKRHLQLFRAMEFLDAWNALDVFFVSLTLARLGARTIGQGVVSVAIPGMTQVAHELFGPEANADVVNAKLRVGYWVMLAVLVLEKCMTYFLMQLSATAIALRELQRNESERELLPTVMERSTSSNLLLYSPADRYVGASGKLASVYAGLPQSIWRTALRLGLLQEEEV